MYCHDLFDSFWRFRPLAGIMVLIWTVLKVDDPEHPGSFRPLTGIVVLISLTTEYECLATSGVSVPLRGLWFLSMSSLKT